MKDLATLQDKTPVHQWLEDVTRSRKKSGKRIRVIDTTGKDRELLQAISDPAVRISGLTNKMIRQHLQGKKWAMCRTNSIRGLRRLKKHKKSGILQNVQKVVYTLWKRLPAAPFSAGMPLPL